MNVENFQQNHEPSSFYDVYTQNFSFIESSNEYRNEELNSYSPYLIEYHEDTRSFTYTDPWIELENNQNTESEHNHVVVDTSSFVEEVTQVATVETETSTMPEQSHDNSEDFHTTHNMNGESYEQSENVVENHFEESEPKPDDEVSFPSANSVNMQKKSFIMCLTTEKKSRVKSLETV